MEMWLIKNLIKYIQYCGDIIDKNFFIKIIYYNNIIKICVISIKQTIIIKL